MNHKYSLVYEETLKVTTFNELDRDLIVHYLEAQSIINIHNITSHNLKDAEQFTPISLPVEKFVRTGRVFYHQLRNFSMKVALFRLTSTADTFLIIQNGTNPGISTYLSCYRQILPWSFT